MRRRRIFAVITILTPFVFLVLLEGILRLVNYGGDLRLVTERSILGHPFLSINRSVGHRYFSGSTIAIPEPPDDYFLPDKPEGALRIFCIGESTMAGFPYEFSPTAPSRLKKLLSERFPGRTIEVINAGMSAVSSAVVCDMMRELTDYDPDLFILYVGHNEFYGAFGAASSQGVSLAPWLTRVYLQALRFRIVLLMRDGLDELRQLSGGNGESVYLMESLASASPIMPGDPVYEACRERYLSNTGRMIDLARSAGVPILVSIPVSNLASLPPFLSVEADLPPVQEEEQGRLLSAARTMLLSGRPDSSTVLLQASLQIDSNRASTWYELGTSLRHAGNNAAALAAFTRARDLDGLRFRMSTDFTDSLVSLCRKEHVPVARIDSAFAAESPGCIPGDELFLEHVHPNIRGYELMAHAWLQSLPVSIPDTADTARLPFSDLSDVTAFDYAMGRIRIAYLRHQWPFAIASAPYEYTPSTQVEAIALRFVRGNLPWQSARYELANLFVSQRQYGLARNEAYAVSRVLPFSYEPLLRIGDYYMMEGRKGKALEAYQICIKTEENPFAWSKIALLRLEQEDFREAVHAFRRAFELDAETAYRLPPAVVATNHHLLGYALIREGKLEEGKGELRTAVRLNPGLTAAADLLRQLGG